MPNPNPADDVIDKLPSEPAAPFDPDKYLMEQYLSEKTGTAPPFDPAAYARGGSDKAPFDPDAYLLEQYLAEKTATPPGALGAVGRGLTRGLGDRILARAQALGAQGAPLPQDIPERSMAADLLAPPAPSRPVDEGRFETDRARILQERRQAGAAAATAHPGFYLAGQVAPALATVLVPGAAEAKAGGALLRLLLAARTGAAYGGVQGLAGSESDNPADVLKEGAAGAATGAVIGPVAESVTQGVSALGRNLLPRAQAFLRTAEQQIADRSAAAKEALNRSAQGTAGAVRANASRTVERLGMNEGLSEAGQAANQAALATPEAQQLAEELAARARGELPEKLGHMRSAQALAEQTAADAAAARSPEAVAEMEKQMRSEVTKRLLTRYLLPGATGYAVDKASGGSGVLGAAAGFGARPMLRATLRGLGSPAFRAPIGRALTSGAESLVGVGEAEASKVAPFLEPEIQPRLAALLDALGRKPALAQNDSDKALDALLK